VASSTKRHGKRKVQEKVDREKTREKKKVLKKKLQGKPVPVTTATGGIIPKERFVGKTNVDKGKKHHSTQTEKKKTLR